MAKVVSTKQCDDPQSMRVWTRDRRIREAVRLIMSESESERADALSQTSFIAWRDSMQLSARAEPEELLTLFLSLEQHWTLRPQHGQCEP